MKLFDRLLVIAAFSFALPVIALIIYPFGAALTKAQDVTPAFSMSFECVLRGPYEGMAQAYISYQYDGAFEVTPEDSRLMGDTTTGETIVLNYPIEPGQHDKALILNVGANKVITWKVILFGKLHVLTAYDNPDIPDCAWATAEPTPEATPNL